MKFSICLSRKAKDQEKKRNGTLAKSKNLRKLLPLLTSDLDIKEKWEIIRIAFQKNGVGNPDMEWLETQLEQVGEYTMAQGIRFIEWIADPKKDIPSWCQKIVEMDIQGRQIVQREIYVQEEMQALQKQLELTPSNPKETAARLTAVEEEASSLNEAFWAYRRRLWKLTSNMGRSPPSQALTTTRQNPD
ncbi:hypothetical protein MW887_007433 [Aspergillus wentii]|nr:hypothetical protein MW887_007433 [Aspergillus wentii]